MKPLLYSLLKLFVVIIVQRRLLCVFRGAKAFVLEWTNTPLKIKQKNWVHRGKKRIEENGRCAA